MPQNDGSELVFVRLMSGAASVDLNNIKRKAVLELHTRRTENGTERARGAALLADDLAEVPGRYLQAQHGTARSIGENIQADGLWFVHQSPGDLEHKRMHLGDSMILRHKMGSSGH